MLKRYGLSLLLLTLARLVFYFVNISYFNNLGVGEIILLMLKGVYFDISAAAIINSLFLLAIILPQPFTCKPWFTTVSNWLYIIPNAIALILNLGDAVYYPFTLKRLTTDIFTYLQNDATSVNMLPKFVVYYWPVTLVGALFLWAFYGVATRLIKPTIRLAPSAGILLFGINITYALLSIVFTVVAFRGGFQLKPINIINAGEFAPAEYAPFILNTPFTLLKTINKKGLIQRTDFTETELENLYTPVSEFNYNKSDFRKLNVVYIILESFSKEHLGLGNEKWENGTYTGFTPFLDSLLKQGLYFPNAFANGKRSIEGIPPLLSGIPTYMDEAYITSPYAASKINSIASLLKPLGYTSAFYHGGFNGTMGFSSFTTMAKFDKYYGKSEYPDQNDYDGNWGISDEPYLQYFAKQLDKTPQPFVTAVFTLSSHQPYIVPKPYQGKMKKGRLPIQACVMYTDMALRKFFAAAAKMAWFNNTLFVISADHCSEAALPYYQTRMGNYRIPILLYHPNSELKGVDTRVIQQTDMLPTVLDYLRFPGKCVAFGSSVFNRQAPRFAMSYLNGTYQLITDSLALQFNGLNATALFAFQQDSLLQNNILSGQPARAKDAERFMKAFLQQYNNRLITNRLTAE